MSANDRRREARHAAKDGAAEFPASGAPSKRFIWPLPAVHGRDPSDWPLSLTRRQRGLEDSVNDYLHIDELFKGTKP